MQLLHLLWLWCHGCGRESGLERWIDFDDGLILLMAAGRPWSRAALMLMLMPSSDGRWLPAAVLVGVVACMVIWTIGLLVPLASVGTSAPVSAMTLSWTRSPATP